VTQTSEPTLTPREVELQRRLVTLVDRATVDAAAWSRIQDRIAGADLPSTPSTRRPRRSRMVAAAAAVVLVVVGIVTVGHRLDDRGKVDTVDDDTTRTTIDRDSQSTTTTSTSTPSELDPGDQPVDGGIGAPGTGPTADAGGNPGSPGGDTPPGATPGAGTTPPTVDPNAAPDGRVPVVTYSLGTRSSDPSVAATVWQDASGFHMNVWRTNPWRLHTTWDWGNVPGQNCLAGATGTISFPELGSSVTFSWGLVRADAAAVRVVTGADDEGSSLIVLGPEALPGLRPWLARTVAVYGADPISQFRAVDSTNATLHSAVAPAWDARPDPC
jgi:hypothetical protein